MPDFEAVSSLKDGTQVQPMLKTPTVGQQSVDDHQVPGVRLSPWGFSSAHNFLESQQAKVVRVERPNSEALFGNSPVRNVHHDMESTPLQIVSRRVFQDITPASQFDTPMENSVPQNVFAEDLEGEIYQEAENNELMASYQDEEAAEAKLKLILRIWRRHSSKLRELREQKLLAANAALNSLSLGLPIRQKRDEPSTLDEFNIDRVLRERYDNLERSWSKLNVSDVVVGELIRRNPGAKCLCFKIIVCSQLNNPGDKMGAGSWLLSKLMPKRKYDDDDDDLVISSPGLSIWKKWVPGQAGTDLTCCLSVIKDIKFDNPNEAVLGASAVLFLVSESIPWERQKIHLHDLLMSLPSGSHLPLLILSGSCKELV
ncbi:hypothetical protein L1049_012462 [Liquidambar formosana]|uniref:Uncharacterized protein n=1 Tax=Liquidambar formosana TaxID=63359 RepID=A0AAP0R559_LIQFO